MMTMEQFKQDLSMDLEEELFAALSGKSQTTGSVSEGSWFVESKDGSEYDGYNPIDVYDHPVKGLCVWSDELSPGMAIDPIITTADGHIPIGLSGLNFLKQNEKDQRQEGAK